MSSQIYFRIRENCPACGSKRFEFLYSCKYLDSPIKEYLEAFYSPQGGVDLDYLAEMEYIIAECTDCKLLFQIHVPDEIMLQKLYDEWIDPEKAIERARRRNSMKVTVAYAREIMRLLTYLDSDPCQLKFLDFGMGWGDWCRMATAFGVNVFGSELSETRIAHVSQIGIGVVTWEQVPGGNFDFINTEQVFEHLVEPFETICHLKKGLKPGGIIKLSVPNCQGIRSRLYAPNWTVHSNWTAGTGSHQCSLNPVAPLEHLNGFNHSSLTNMAERAGLEPVQIPLYHKYAFNTYYLPSARLKPVDFLRLLHRKLLQPLREHRAKGTYLFFRLK